MEQEACHKLERVQDVIRPAASEGIADSLAPGLAGKNPALQAGVANSRVTFDEMRAALQRHDEPRDGDSQVRRR